MSVNRQRPQHALWFVRLAKQSYPKAVEDSLRACDESKNVTRQTSSPAASTAHQADNWSIHKFNGEVQIKGQTNERNGETIVLQISAADGVSSLGLRIVDELVRQGAELFDTRTIPSDKF